MTGKKSKGKSKGGASGGLSDGAFAFRSAFGERIRTLLDMYDSRPDAAAVAGVTPEHLASYISGRAKPPFELVTRLANDKGVSLQWLANGQGKQDLAEAADGFTVIPVLETDSYSGGTVAYTQPGEVREQIAFARDWLKAVIAEPESALRVVFNRGSDNTPAIGDGHAMLVVPGVESVSEDGYYILKPDGQRMITRKVKMHVGNISLMTLRDEQKPENFTAAEANRMVFARIRWSGGVL